MKVGEALQSYLRAYDFGDTQGGYDDRWARLKFGRVVFWVPNIEARRQAVKRHDVNHILTGYEPIVLKGELQIAAFELASGCGKYWFAWFVNLVGLPLMVFYPRLCVRAFFRGLRTRRNIYRDYTLGEAVWARSVDDLRLEMGISDLDKPVKKPTIVLSW